MLRALSHRGMRTKRHRTATEGGLDGGAPPGVARGRSGRRRASVLSGTRAPCGPQRQPGARAHSHTCARASVAVLSMVTSNCKRPERPSAGEQTTWSLACPCDGAPPAPAGRALRHGGTTRHRGRGALRGRSRT